MRGKLAAERGSGYIGDMDKNASIFDMVDEDRKRKAIEEGIAQADAGKVVPHEIVKVWLQKLANGEFDAPPPQSTDNK